MAIQISQLQGAYSDALAPLISRLNNQNSEKNANRRGLLDNITKGITTAAQYVAQNNYTDALVANREAQEAGELERALMTDKREREAAAAKQAFDISERNNEQAFELKKLDFQAKQDQLKSRGFKERIDTFVKIQEAIKNGSITQAEGDSMARAYQNYFTPPEAKKGPASPLTGLQAESIADPIEPEPATAESLFNFEEVIKQLQSEKDLDTKLKEAQISNYDATATKNKALADKAKREGTGGGGGLSPTITNPTLTYSDGTPAPYKIEGALKADRESFRARKYSKDKVTARGAIEEAGKELSSVNGLNPVIDLTTRSYNILDRVEQNYPASIQADIWGEIGKAIKNGALKETAFIDALVKRGVKPADARELFTLRNAIDGTATITARNVLQEKGNIPETDTDRVLALISYSPGMSLAQQKRNIQNAIEILTQTAADRLLSTEQDDSAKIYVDTYQLYTKRPYAYKSFGKSINQDTTSTTQSPTDKKKGALDAIRKYGSI